MQGLESVLSDELRAFGAELQQWAVSAIRPHARRADIDHAPPANAMQILASAPAPLWALASKEPSVTDFVDGVDMVYMVFREAVGYGDVWPTQILSPGIGHLVVKAIGTAEQVELWHDAVLASGQKMAFGLTEPGTGSDTSQIITTARRDGDRWILNGIKMYCSMGAIADYIMVFATIDKTLGRAGIRAFVVPRDTPGLVVVKPNEDKLGMRSWITSQIALDGCAVPLLNMLGVTDAEHDKAANGLAGALSTLNDNRANVSAMSLSLARAGLDETRTLLGSHVSGYTGPRAAIVHAQIDQMAHAIDRARLVNYTAQAKNASLLRNRVNIPVAKAFGPPIAERVLARCMQLLGPDGASEDLLLEKWYRDVKICDIFEGTGEMMRILIARHLMGRGAAR